MCIVCAIRGKRNGHVYHFVKDSIIASFSCESCQCVTIYTNTLFLLKRESVYSSRLRVYAASFCEMLVNPFSYVWLGKPLFRSNGRECLLERYICLDFTFGCFPLLFIAWHSDDKYSKVYLKEPEVIKTKRSFFRIDYALMTAKTQGKNSICAISEF